MLRKSLMILAGLILTSCTAVKDTNMRTYSGNANSTATPGPSAQLPIPTVPQGTQQIPQQPLLQSNTEPNYDDSSACIKAPSMDICRIEAYIVKYTNEYRAQKNLRPLIQDYKMSVVARNWSQSQSKVGFISHLGFPYARNSNYLSEFQSSPEMSIGAENVAMNGYSSGDIARSFTEMWWNSSGHRANMVGNYNRIGVGIYRKINGSYYATQIFGNAN